MKPYHIYCAISLILHALLSASCGLTPVGLKAAGDLAGSAQLHFYSGPGIQSSGWSVDGVRQGLFDSGLRVAPGEHSAYNDFQFETQKCPWSSDSFCYEAALFGNCNAKFRASSGQSYAVRITRTADQAFVSVEDKETGEVAGSGSCEITRSAASATSGSIRWY